MPAPTHVEPFAPPPPVPGCECGVCNPGITEDQLRAFEQQMQSPFVRYRIMKDLGDGNKRCLSDEELRLLERDRPDLCEWVKEPKSMKINWKGKCAAILKKLLGNKRFGVYFNEPVDPEKHAAPGYFDYIKHPMDLATVGKRLEGGTLHNPDDFIALVRLTFRNCFLYNPEGSHARTAAREMSLVFERELLKLWGGDGAGGQ